MTSLKLALALWIRDGIISLVAAAGWPKCPWLSRLVDRLTILAEALTEKAGVRA